MHRQHGGLQPLIDNASEKQPHTSKGLLRCLQILFSSGTASDSAGVLSVIGNGIFKCFKIADNNLKLLTSALTKHEPLNYTAHAWVMDGALAVVTGVVVFNSLAGIPAWCSSLFGQAGRRVAAGSRSLEWVCHLGCLGWLSMGDTT